MTRNRTLGSWIADVYARRPAAPAPDLVARYRQVWAIPNAAIRTVSAVRRADGPRRTEADAARRADYAVGLYDLSDAR